MSLACELKYCECCGALLVRHTQSSQTYCGRCHQLLITPELSISALRTLLESRKPRRRRPASAPAPMATAADPVQLALQEVL